MSRHIAVRRTAMAAALSAVFSAGALLAPAAAHAAAWANTATQAMPLKGFAGVAPMAATQRLHIVVGLNPRNKAQLDALVAQIGKPGSAQFGHTITPAQFAATYAPTAAQVNAVVGYLRSAGFDTIETSGNNLTVSAYGSAAVVQGAFNTRLVSFVAGGRNLFANSAPAQVPAALDGIVSAVVGLQNMGQMQTAIKHSDFTPAQIKAARAAALKPHAGVPQNPITTAPYSGPQYQAAYDAAGTPTGWGTSIGIVTEGDLSQVLLDLRSYEKE